MLQMAALPLTFTPLRVQRERTKLSSPGQVAQLVIALSPYTEVVGLIPRQGTYKRK